MSKKKELPIGIEDFKVLIDNNYYFVDKTDFLRELTNSIGKVNLFTRPRRFGKSLNMSMIQRFFEKTEESNAYLFEGLHIAKDEKCMAYQGQYPVITISLKGAAAPNFDLAFTRFKALIAEEYNRHRELLDSTKISESHKKSIRQICDGEGDYAAYSSSLKFLSDRLYEEYGKKVIILIDEYDVPLEKAHFNGYYPEMIDLIRSLFHDALKTNHSLEFAVLTGCLRVSKESLFTGLNNLRINSVLTAQYSEYFGFTEPEVQQLVEYYGLSEQFPTIKEWYDGYRFGETEIYNPWSFLNYVQDLYISKNALPTPYWSNTSSNSIIRQLITESDEDTRDQVEELINGGSITAPIHEDIVYADIDVNQESIWSFLLFTGYLKQINSRLQGDDICMEMVIPNREIRSIFKRNVRQWFDDATRKASRADLLEALLSQNVEQVNKIVGTWLNETISFYDEKEQYYHGFMAGLLSGFKGYKLVSNRESGNGRPDLILKQRNGSDIAIVIEIKAANPKNKETLEGKLKEAIKQIEKNNYAEELRNDGYQTIIQYGVAFREKKCMIGVLK